jgi:hypothetical protein
MITDDDYKFETVRAVLTLRRDAEDCFACNGKPDHQRDPGCRTIGCSRGDCPRVVGDGSLLDGFREWNRRMRQQKMIDRRKR